MSLDFLKTEPCGLLNAIFANIPYDLCANELAGVCRKVCTADTPERERERERERAEKRCRNGPWGAGNTIMVKNRSKLQLQNFVQRLY